MQARSLEKPAPVGGSHLQFHRAPVAIDRHGHFDPGSAERPDTAKEAREIADFSPADRKHDVAGAQIGLACRPAAGEADHHDAVVDLGGEEAEPRARWPIAGAIADEVVEYRFEQIDRDAHVQMLVALLARLFQLQRTDPQEIAVRPDHGGAAPVGVGRGGEDRLVEHIFPIAGEFLPGRDARRDRMMASAGSPDHDALANSRFSRRPDRERRKLDSRQRLDQPKTGLLVVAEHVARRWAAVAESKPNLLGFGNQITDREYNAVFADEDAIARALGAECLGREGVAWNDGSDPYDRSERTIEIILVILRFRLDGGRYPPIRRGHSRTPLAPRYPTDRDRCRARRAYHFPSARTNGVGWVKARLERSRHVLRVLGRAETHYRATGFAPPLLPGA